jgi:cell division protease FtsH
MDANKSTSDNTQDTKHYHDKIDAALERWMLEGQKKIEKLVDEHWETIEKLSKVLLEKEIIYEDELNELLSK